MSSTTAPVTPAGTISQIARGGGELRRHVGDRSCADRAERRRARRPRRCRGRTRRTRGRRPSNAARGSRPCDRVRSFRAASQLLFGSEVVRPRARAPRASAAPTMPARLPSSATRTSQPGSTPIEELVGVLHDAAADHDELGGQTISCSCDEVTVEATGPPLPRKILGHSGRVGDPGRRRGGPSTKMCPSSELGTNAPSFNSAVPTPVPTVTIDHESASCPRAAPKRASAMPAASASFSTTHGRSVARAERVCGVRRRSTTCRCWSRYAPRRS